MNGSARSIAEILRQVREVEVRWREENRSRAERGKGSAEAMLKGGAEDARSRAMSEAGAEFAAEPLVTQP